MITRDLRQARDLCDVAEPGFYAAVTARVKRATVIVVEGVGGGAKKRSLLASALMLSYRVLRFNRRMTLVEQNIDYASLDADMVHPDVSLQDGVVAVDGAERSAHTGRGRLRGGDA